MNLLFPESSLFPLLLSLFSFPSSLTSTSNTCHRPYCTPPFLLYSFTQASGEEPQMSRAFVENESSESATLLSFQPHRPSGNTLIIVTSDLPPLLITRANIHPFLRTRCSSFRAKLMLPDYPPAT